MHREHSTDRLVQARVVEDDALQADMRGDDGDENPYKKNRACEEHLVLPTHPPLSPPFLGDLKEAIEAFGNTRTLRFFLRMFAMVCSAAVPPTLTS